MLRPLLIVSGLLLSLNSYACDTKPCEKAYVSATKQYINNDYRRAKAQIQVTKIYVKNDNRRANAYRSERLAYSKIREKRDYALRQHLLSMQAKKKIKGRNKAAS